MEKYQIDFDRITPQDLTTIAVICSKIFRIDSDHTHWLHHIPPNTNYYIDENEILYRTQPSSYHGSIPHIIKREDHPAEFEEIATILTKYQRYKLIDASECKLCGYTRCCILNVLIQTWSDCAKIVHLDNRHPGYRLMRSYIDGSATDEDMEALKEWLSPDILNDTWGFYMRDISLLLYNTICDMPSYQIHMARSMRKGYSMIKCIGDCVDCDIEKVALI